MSLAQAIAEAGGIPSAFLKDTPVGTAVTGTIESADLRQTTDFETQTPETWDDGSPKMQVVVTLHTALRDPSNPDDDGKRRVYVKWWGDQKKALLQAIFASKDTDLRPGGTFTAQFTGLGQATGRLNAPKLYSFAYTPPPTGLAQAVQATAPAPQAAPAAPPQAYQQPAPVQPAAPAVDFAAIAAQQAAAAQVAPPAPAAAPGPEVWGPPQPAAPAAPAPQQGGQDVELASKIQQLQAVGLTPEAIGAALGLTVEQVRANTPF